MRVGIVGCGRMGVKRFEALGPSHRLAAVADADPGRARALADRAAGAVVADDWRKLVRRSDLDAVIVSTPHDLLVPVAVAAVQAGKHVLVEKPAARNPRELGALEEAVSRHARCVHVGFNHRFHPALAQAKQIVDSGTLGPLLYLRGRYGHGGRPGYEKEWRADPAVSGGGELLDQGSHLIDLARWFLGDFDRVEGHVATYFWDIRVEDNAFMSLRTPHGSTAWLHVSWTEWKNTFCLELFAKTGKIQVDGLGGSYGAERLTLYRMRPEMGPPEVESTSFEGPDRSWELEFELFAEAAAKGTPPPVSLADARACLEIVDRLYQASKS